MDGPVELKVPPGTQPGTTLLMAKRGVPRLANPAIRGDHQASAVICHSVCHLLSWLACQPSRFGGSCSFC